MQLTQATQKQEHNTHITSLITLLLVSFVSPSSFILSSNIVPIMLKIIMIPNKTQNSMSLLTNCSITVVAVALYLLNQMIASRAPPNLQ
jgi:hypothetical protein